MGLKTLQFQRLLFLSTVLVLRNAVAVAVNPFTSHQPSWFQHSVNYQIDHSRPRRDMTAGDSGKSSSQCPGVDECFANTTGAFADVMTEFRIGEVYKESLSLCSKPPVQDCWDDACDDLMMKHKISLLGRTAAFVCEKQDALRAALVCEQGALGDKFNACGLQAHTQLMSQAQNFNPVAFAKYYLVCGLDVIDSIPFPCQDENKTFLKSFFQFVIDEHFNKNTPGHPS